MPDRELSDSAVQRRAEADIIAASEGLNCREVPGRITLTGDVCVEVDARTNDGSVFVEAYARQGSLKGAQLKKIGQDVLKLALVKREAEYANARAIIAFAGDEARDSATPSEAGCSERRELFDVELRVVSISSDLRAGILSAQGRQLWRASQIRTPDLYKVQPGMEDGECRNGAGILLRSSRTRR